MLLKVAPSFGLLNSHGEDLGPVFSAIHAQKSFAGEKWKWRGVQCFICLSCHVCLTSIEITLPSRVLPSFSRSPVKRKEDHAEKLMEYQNKRGGKVKLQSILMPLSEFDHVEKGEALYAMELALSLEKLTNEKLLNLHAVASRTNDVQLTHFIENEFLAEQVESIKKISEYVAQLRRVGKGHGVWHFDQMLLQEEQAA
ncbi:ferritin-2 [Forsythia ovata]|uniref:Ferritin n=1 Tax=Forsythia ovata TaxID=205694 RepID=A0ABD1X8G1_9LAMI